MAFRRPPKLLGPDDLPPEFSYPEQLRGAITGESFGEWEWLHGGRLRETVRELWKHYPREVVPFALRRGTAFVACFDAERPAPDGSYEVVTIDAREDREPLQHCPDLATWLNGARAEARGELAPPPQEMPSSGPAPDSYPAEEVWSNDSGGWQPPERGACGCVHHLDAFATQLVPYGANAPDGLPPRRVADLVMAHEIDAENGFPGPELAWKGRPLGPFHWRVHLGEGARLHFDLDGRQPMEAWLMFNPGVELVVWPDRGDLYLVAPTLCRDGVLTLFARALLDDRLRKRRKRR
ncbi:MAG: hypothetical protein WB767_02565 [Nocardioides sp.]